jgi:uncharacterized pyridoxamine 5'-phosphate oxidase family protein/Pyruvate/2-oxoacid:ferredoxin oxidoreductase delta subunit
MLYTVKETPEFEGKEILYGLNENSTNEEIKAKAFELLKKVRSMPAATVKDGLPEIRVIDFCLLSDGYFYFIASKGKNIHEQLMKTPYIALCERIERWYAVRLMAHVTPVMDKKVWDEFFLYNQGSASMYASNPHLLELFKLDAGEGEVFHLYHDQRLKRARFAFGGMEVKPMNYTITDRCTGCGICLEACMESAIVEDGEKYKISNMDCNDCGKCYVVCPEEAIDCRLYNEEWHERMMNSLKLND